MVRAAAALAAFGLIRAAAGFEVQLKPSVAKAEHEVQLKKLEKIHTEFLERPRHAKTLAAKDSLAAEKKKPSQDEPSPAAKSVAAAAKDTEVTESKDVNVNDSEEDADTSAVAAVQEEIAEVEQNRDNVKETEIALKADVAMLRQSTKIHRLAKSRANKLRTKRQVERGEKLVKVATTMVEDSRAEAVESAHRALEEAAAIRKAADSLSSEANGALRQLSQKK